MFSNEANPRKCFNLLGQHTLKLDQRRLLYSVCSKFNYLKVGEFCTFQFLQTQINFTSLHKCCSLMFELLIIQITIKSDFLFFYNSLRSLNFETFVFNHKRVS